MLNSKGDDMINRILEIYEEEMSQILPIRWDWRGSLLAIGTMVMVVMVIVAIMFTIGGIF